MGPSILRAALLCSPSSAARLLIALLLLLLGQVPAARGAATQYALQHTLDAHSKSFLREFVFRDVRLPPRTHSSRLPWKAVEGLTVD